MTYRFEYQCLYGCVLDIFNYVYTGNRNMYARETHQAWDLHVPHRNIEGLTSEEIV